MKSEKCPYCNSPCDADWVHIGVELMRCGPYHCDVCGASEMGPEAAVHTCIGTVDERKTGWYGNRLSPYANTF